MKLKYVVITSVDRDDLLDRGATHFVTCIDKIREECSEIKIEILVPISVQRLMMPLVF